MTTSNTTLRIFFFSVVSALAGFLFGFDTVVISGAERIWVDPFPGMMVLQLVWVKLWVPETKGVSLEAMQHKLGIE